jgi:hypothetical protein
MGICAREICIWGSPYEQLPKKAFFGPFMFAYGVCLHMVISDVMPGRMGGGEKVKARGEDGRVNHETDPTIKQG